MVLAIAQPPEAMTLQWFGSIGLVDLAT